MKAVGACARQHVIDCHADARTAARIARADARLRAVVASRCCGTDGLCGTGDDDALVAIGWGAGVCPNLDRGDCNQLIHHPGDVASCLACIGRAAADDLAALTVVPAPGNASAARCTGAAVKESTRLVLATSKALARCWAGRGAGAHTNPCPDPGDGRAAAAITAAITRATATLCKGCGGTDALCGGGDDVDPTAIGFAGACPDVALPGGPACGGPIATATDLVACVTCLGGHLSECVDRASVPAFTAYPTECADPPGACSPGVECTSGADCPSGAECLDNGSGTTRYCVGATCSVDAECDGGQVCRQYCTFAGCTVRRCVCPGFSCGVSEVCIDDGGLACRQLCTQDSDCPPPLGVCVNFTFGAGLCISSTPCQ
jgi:hypothetical protein